MATDAELAWAAGLFEGEGSVCPSNARRAEKGYGARAQIAMTDLDVLKTFQAVIGMGVVLPKKTGGLGTKKQWSWQVSSRVEVERLFEMIGPKLHGRRLGQFQAALRPIPTGKCLNCARSFQSIRAAHSHEQGRPRFCSVECRTAHNNEKTRLRRRIPVVNPGQLQVGGF